MKQYEKKRLEEQMLEVIPGGFVMDKNKVEICDKDIEKVSGGVHHNGVIMVGGIKPWIPADCLYCDNNIRYYPEDIDADGYVTCTVCKNRIKVQ